MRSALARHEPAPCQGAALVLANRAASAVLMLGISKSGLGAGFGSLALPVMALAVSVPQAAAILMPVLLLMDVLGLAAFRRNFKLSLIRFLVPFGLAGTLAGALLFLAQRLLLAGRKLLGDRFFLIFAGLTGAASKLIADCA